MEPPFAPDLARGTDAQQVHAGFLETLLFKGLSTPLGFILVIVQSRFLHTSGRGAFVLAVLTVTILARLLGQLGYAVTNRLQGHGLELRGLVHRAFAVGIVLGALGTAAVVGLGLVSIGIRTSVAAIAACALVPTIGWQCVSGVLLGLGKIRLWNVIQTLPPLLTLAGMLVLVAGLGLGVRGAVTAWTIAQVLTAVVALAAARGLWQPLDLRRLLTLFDLPLARFAVTMGIVHVVALLSYRVELYVLDRDRGVAQVGVYSVAVQTAEVVWLVAGAIATAVTAPCLHEDEQRAAALITRSALKALAYTAVVAVGLGAVAPLVIPPVLGSAFSGASTPLRLLLPGIVAYAPVTVLVVYVSVRRGRPDLSIVVSVVGMLVTLAAAIVLIPAHGASGAAVASSVGYLAGAAVAWTTLVYLARKPEPTPAPAV